MTREELIERLVWTAPFVVTAVVGRLFWRAFSLEAMPTDAESERLWRRRFRWMIASELTSVPALIATALVVPSYLQWSVEAGSLFSLILGTLGYGVAASAGRAVAGQWLKTKAGVAVDG